MSTSSGSGSGSSAGDAVGDVINSYQSGMSNRATAAVLIQIGTQAVIAVVCMALFMALRARNKMIFMPRYKYSADEKRPPKLSDGPLGWIPPVMKLKEPEMLEKVGLDAVVFLRFLRMSRWICTVVAVGSIAILLPINYIKNSQSKAQLGFLTKITISNVHGNILYAHVAFSYFVCFVTYVFIYFNYRRIVALRWQWFQSPTYQNSLYARSIMITRVATKFRSDPGLQSLLDQTRVPYPTTSVHIGRRVGTLPQLVVLHNDTVRQLEQVLTTYLRKGEKGLDKRPTMKVGSTLGLGGRRVDAIDYLTDKIKRLEEKIHAVRETITDHKAENYGFASFGTVAWAHMVGQKLRSNRVKGAKFELAPPPHDIIWENITRSDSVRFSRQVTGFVVLVFLMGLFVIPVTAAALVANLTALTQYVTFLADWSNSSNWSFSAVLGIAPVAINALAQVLIAATIRWLAKYMVAPTEMKLDRSVMARYFAFLFITQFIIFNVLSVIVRTSEKIASTIGAHGSAHAVYEEFKQVPGEIQGTYVEMSNYWIGWLAAKAAGPPLDMLQLPAFFMAWLRSKLFRRTPRAVREWTKPTEFDYSIYIANMMLLLVVAFVYAPLAPFVPLFAMIAFFVSSWLYKYQLLYVSDTRCESGGRMARMIVNRILFCLVIMNLFMVLTIGLQLGWPMAPTAAPPILFSIMFKIFIKYRFDKRFDFYLPDQAELEGAHIHQSDERKDRLQKRFGHPSLHAELFFPMVHQKDQHLLSRVYSGRTEETSEMLDDHKVEGATVGGLTFTAVGEHDLQYSRMQYLRERDEDAMSVSTALLSRAGGPGGAGAVEGKHPYGEEFERQRAAYLAAGRPEPHHNVDGSSYPPSKYGGSYADLDPSQTAHIRWPSQAPSFSSSYEHPAYYARSANPSQASLMPSRYSTEMQRQIVGSPPVGVGSDQDRFDHYAQEQMYPPAAAPGPAYYPEEEERLGQSFTPPMAAYGSPRQHGSPGQHSSPRF